MTFNPNADIRSSDVSRAGGRSGGLGGRGMMIGGGGGGCLLIAIVLIYALMGGNIGDILGSGSPQGQQQGQPAAQDPVGGQSYDEECRTGEDANTKDLCLVGAVMASADTVWSGLAPQMGVGFAQPHGSIFSGQVNTGCGAASAAVGPFYCPADQTIYIDTSFYDDLTSRFGADGGQLAKEYVIAHEYGHHMQNLQGTMERIDHSRTGADSDSVRLELQADCYAGVWANHAATSQDQNGQTFLQPLTDQDIESALSAASAVGDDHIQRDVSGGQVNPESWTHGSSEQRRQWFTTGYQTGDPASCNTFAGAI
ncbi:KPN_02809 family neutral zinc metallopeptidase [Brachybacterium huguangmaarense]